MKIIKKFRFNGLHDIMLIVKFEKLQGKDNCIGCPDEGNRWGGIVQTYAGTRSSICGGAPSTDPIV